MQVELPIGDAGKTSRRARAAAHLGSVRTRLLAKVGRTAEGVAQHAGEISQIVWVAITSLVTKSIAACKQERVPRLVLGGGVAANRGLRALAGERCREEGIALFVPPLASCTDNAAMIAYAGSQRLVRGERDGFELSVFSSSPKLRSSHQSA